MSGSKREKSQLRRHCRLSKSSHHLPFNLWYPRQRGFKITRVNFKVFVVAFFTKMEAPSGGGSIEFLSTGRVEQVSPFAS